MKVILLEDVRNVGAAGAVASVADGYARNYLFPRSLAIPANAGNLKNLEQHRSTIKRSHQSALSDASAASERLAEITVTLKAKSGEAGRLYGSITPAMVAEALEAEHALSIDRRAISFAHPVRVLGTHEATVHLHKEIEATLRIEVAPEEATED